MKTAESQKKSKPVKLKLSKAAAAVLWESDLCIAFLRFCSGDWGEIDDQAWKENDVANDFGFRVRSVYTSRSGVKFVVTSGPDASIVRVELLTESSKGNPVSH